MGASGSGASSDGGDPTIELTPAAQQIAAAMCAAQNLQGPPPSQVGSGLNPQLHWGRGLGVLPVSAGQLVGCKLG